MGNVIGNSTKRITRFAGRFNLENRVNKVLEQEKPKPAPRHETTAKILEQFAADHPDLFDEQKKKDSELHERLKQIRIDSTGNLPELKSRPLPDRNRPSEPKISGYGGFLDPKNVPEGKLSLGNIMKILTKVQETAVLDPKAVRDIAKEYKLDVLQVQQLVRYFKAPNIKFPDNLQKKYPTLAEDLSNVGRKGVDNFVSGVKANKEARKGLLDEAKEKLFQRRIKTESATKPKPSYTESATEHKPLNTDSATEPEPSYTDSATEPEPSYTDSATEPEPSYTDSGTKPEPYIDEVDLKGHDWTVIKQQLNIKKSEEKSRDKRKSTVEDHNKEGETTSNNDTQSSDVPNNKS